MGVRQEWGDYNGWHA